MAEKQHKDPILFNVDEHVFSGVLDEIDHTNFMRVGKTSSTRGGLILFAMALGWHNGLKVGLKKVHGGGLARRESFSSEIPVVINAVHFADLGYTNPDELRYLDDAYAVAEEYANGGFNLIEGELNSKTTSEEFANNLVAEMDEMYEKLFGEGV